jgi:hypothetical protein
MNETLNKGPRCVQCGKPYDHGCNSDFCSLDCEEAHDDTSVFQAHHCRQCGKDMGNEWILGPVCGKCCRANHKHAVGR